VHGSEGAEFPALTVKNLEMGAWTNTSSSVTGDIEWVFDIFPVLRERRSQHAGTLSGGEQGMLALARGLMMRPSLLCLDEPSLGLAPIIIARLSEALGRIISERRLSILLVEQNFNMAFQLSRRAYILSLGILL
jgi:branched-chain amino acid transport system ATP-binding protein